MPNPKPENVVKWEQYVWDELRRRPKVPEGKCEGILVSPGFLERARVAIVYGRVNEEHAEDTVAEIDTMLSALRVGDDSD